MYLLSLIKLKNYVIVFHKIPSENWFKRTLRTIGKIYKFIPIEDIESYYYNNKKFNSCVHICFDDGDKTVYYNAFPVLKEMDIPASLFVSPKIIRNEENYWFQNVRCIDDELLKRTVCELMNCSYEQINKYSNFSILKSLKIKDILKVIAVIREKHNMLFKERINITEHQLIELHNSDLIKIGAHSMNHPILNNETYNFSEKEIKESMTKLSQMINSEIKYFAYPNGKSGLDYSEREIKILKENNIKLAFTGDNSFFNKKNNPLAIPRGGLSLGGKTFVLSKILLGQNWEKIKKTKKHSMTEEEQRKEIINLSVF